jgi:ATP-dependent exoDNAse (exonuclease V) beta subunit
LRVRSAWLALGGPGTTQSALDLAGTDRLFALLDAHERAGDLPDFDAFVGATERLYATLPGADLEGVQVMTLHKAKGLEFDAVILPGLDRSTKGGQPPLLRWKARDTGGRRTLVIAPVRGRVGASPQPDPICDWLERLDQAEEAAELGRVLYVGATRARGRLHLMAVGQIDTREAEPTWKRPDKGSALERLWDALAHALAPPAPPAANVSEDAEPGADAAPTAAPLVRMPAEWAWPAASARLPAPLAAPAVVSTPVFEWAEATAAAIGTVAHRLLAQIGREGLAAWDTARVARAAPRLRAELALAGVPAGEREAALGRVTRAIERTLADPRGRWLFEPSHAERRTEWMLAGHDEGRIAHVALDYTFVDAAGVRWIVDYKTGSHEGGSADAFLDRELERYRPQLERYGRLMRGLEPAPIRLALYYPLVDGGFRSFDFRG